MIGKILSNRYKLISELGTGGMAWVYLAEDLKKGHKVAIKILYPQLSQDLGFLQRFNQEAKLVMSLSQTLTERRVVRVLDYGSDQDTRYLVMEYVEGQDLRQVLNETGALPWRTALDITWQIALALEHAHQHGIVHRDVKPANVMLLPDGTVRVLDFGIARARTSPTLTQSGFVGSPHYVAPEQAMGRRVDIRADLYSLGVVLYEMITGNRPFCSETPWAVINQHIATPPPPLEEVRPDVPVSVARLLRKALAKRRQDRFQTPAEMIQTIELVLSGEELVINSQAAKPDTLSALLDKLYEKAQLFVKREDWREAVDLFSQILKLDPRYRDVTEQLAEAGRQARLAALYDAAKRSIKAGHWDDALAQLYEIAKIVPNYRDIQTLHATVKREQKKNRASQQDVHSLEEAKEWAVAMKSLDQLHEQTPDHVPGIELTTPTNTVPEKQKVATTQDRPLPVPQSERLHRRNTLWLAITVLLLVLLVTGYFLYQAEQPSAVAAVSSTLTMTIVPSTVIASPTPTAIRPSITSARQPPTPTSRPSPSSTPPTPTPTPIPTSSHTPIPTPTTKPSLTHTPLATLTRTPTPTATLTTEPTRQPSSPATPRLEGQIAFPRFDPTRKTYDVYICRTDGSNCKRVAVEASQPDLLPGGSQVVVHSWEADDKGIVLQTLSGRRIWQITGIIEAARPSVDFQGKAYTYHSRHMANRLPYLYRTYGPETWPILREANPIQGHSPSWLPNGQILYSGCLGDECGIIAMRGNGTYPRQVAAGGSETNPESSPNGQQVAFMSQRDGNWEVYIVNLDGSDLQRLTRNPANDGLPTWSPDGRYIAFVSDRDGSWAVWVMHPDGSGQRRLFEIGGPLDGQLLGSASHEIHGWVEERISWSSLP